MRSARNNGCLLAAIATAALTLARTGGLAMAAEVHPFAQLGLEGAFDGNISGHGNIAVAPWNAIYSKGAQDWRGGLVAGGGAEVDVDDRLSALCVMDLSGQRYLDYPELSGFSGTAVVQGKAVDLPGDLDGLVTYTYRDDFLGDRGHDLTGGVERPLPFAVVGHVDAGYDWSMTVDSALAHQGPFADFGANRSFRSTGTTLFANLTGLAQNYSARTDWLLSAAAGVSQAIGGSASIFGQASYDWAWSTESDRSLSSPEVVVGSGWTFQ